jgi:hypothetical protein
LFTLRPVAGAVAGRRVDPELRQGQGGGGRYRSRSTGRQRPHDTGRDESQRIAVGLLWDCCWIAVGLLLFGAVAVAADAKEGPEEVR